MEIEQQKQSDLPWVEKYRPNKLEDLISHESIIQTLNRFVESNNLPNLLFYGPPGTGKTSTIISICRKMYGSEYKQMVLELNASDDRGINVVREEIKNFASMSTMGMLRLGRKEGEESGKKNQVKLIILDEADEMTSEAQFALRRIVEKYGKVCRFCLICNHVSKIIPALQSRCTRFKFNSIKYEHAQQRLRHILEQENLQVDQAAQEVVFTICQGDMRKTVNLFQSLSLQSPLQPVDSQFVYQVTGTLHPNSVLQLYNHLTLKSNTLQQLHQYLYSLVQQGISLNTIIDHLLQQILISQISPQALVYLFTQLAALEYRLTLDVSINVQLLSLAAIFKQAHFL